MTDKQIIEPCMGCSALECWGVVDCDVAQRVLALHKTLTEIKEIAEKCCINQATLDCENYDDCTQCGRISDGEGIQQILRKISEVIE